jgi:uncharacterized membrane protein
LAALAYALYAVWEHDHFMTDYDLAVNDQTVWHYSHLQAPRITMLVPPLDALGDHFSPILALLAPLYWLWSDPRMLLIAQALLIGASIVPVFLFAQPRLGRIGSYLLSTAYAAFWGISAAVGYQFHADAFAPLLIALAILLADRCRWTGFFITIAALLLVKENMSVLVAFIGLWLATGGELRRGIATAVIGIAAYFITVDLLMPAISGAHYAHWTYTDFGGGPLDAVWHVVRNPVLPIEDLVDDPTKRSTLAYLFLPFLGLTLCSRLAFVSLPLVAQQLYSDSHLYWGTDFHYWLAISPVLAMGAADGLHNVLRRLDRESSVRVAASAICAVILAANLALASRFPLWTLVSPGVSFSPSASDRAHQRAIDAVPPDASATVPAPLLPHMSQRSDIYVLGYPSPSTDYVVFVPGADFWPDPEYARTWLTQHHSEYRLAQARDGWVVWRRVARLRP